MRISNPGGKADSPIISYRFNRTAGQGFFARSEFTIVFRLLADVGVRALERPSKVCGSSLSADVAIYAGRINVKGAVDIVLNLVVWIGHGPADYADRTNSARRGGLWQWDKSVLLISGASAPHRDPTGSNTQLPQC